MRFLLQMTFLCLAFGIHFIFEFHSSFTFIVIFWRFFSIKKSLFIPSSYNFPSTLIIYFFFPLFNAKNTIISWFNPDRGNKQIKNRRIINKCLSRVCRADHSIKTMHKHNSNVDFVHQFICIPFTLLFTYCEIMSSFNTQQIRSWRAKMSRYIKIHFKKLFYSFAIQIKKNFWLLLINIAVPPYLSICWVWSKHSCKINRRMFLFFIFVSPK